MQICVKTAYEIDKAVGIHEQTCMCRGTKGLGSSGSSATGTAHKISKVFKIFQKISKGLVVFMFLVFMSLLLPFYDKYWMLHSALTLNCLNYVYIHLCVHMFYVYSLRMVMIFKMSFVFVYLIMCWLSFHFHIACDVQIQVLCFAVFCVGWFSSV